MYTLPKDELRKQMLETRDKLLEHERAEMSRAMRDKLFSLKEIKKCRRVCFYITKDSEVDTIPMIVEALKQRKIVIVPVTRKEIELVYFTSFNDLVHGQFGVPEPGHKIISTTPPDVMIIPGLAFDKSRHRVGYGKGYYDTLLKKINSFKVGVCFDFQVVDKIKSGKHDMKVDIIITEERIIK